MRRPSRRQLLRQGAGIAALALGSLPAASAKAAPALPDFRRGVNTWPWFSLTREYPAPRTDYAWPPFQAQRPVPQPADLARLRAAGFDFVRIPVDPGPFIAFTGSDRVNLMQSLTGAVSSAVAAGLSVIVNIQANGATHYYTPQRLFGSPAAPLFGAYLDFVELVARSLAPWDPRQIALEPVNEPPQACTAAVWQDMQMTLLTRARAAAPLLPLIATGSCGSMVMGLDTLNPAPLEALAPMLYTFHFYEPYLFSHQGAPWMTEPVYRSLNAVPWPASAGTLDRTLAPVRTRMAQDTATSAEAKRLAYQQTVRVITEYFAARPDRPFLEHYLSVAKAWAERNAIPVGRVVMSEFGALRSDARYVAATAADRARYVRDVRLSAEAIGFPWAFWNMFDGMGLMDDTTRVLDPAMITALGLTVPAG